MLKGTMVRRFFSLLSLFLLPFAAGYAQEGSSVITHHYSTAEGLPSNNVLCALKDKDGFLWFGTWYGLCRFDGERFHTYNKSFRTDAVIPPRKVESLAEDAQGRLWLKTVDWKLYVFDRTTEQFRAINDELKKYTDNLQVIKIQRTDDGKILLLTKDKTLLLAYTNGRGQIVIHRLFHSKGQINPQSLQLYHDIMAKSDGYAFFIGQDYRLFMVKGTLKVLQKAMTEQEAQGKQQDSRLQQLVAKAGISKYSHLYMDSDSLLWISTNNDGVFCVSQPRHLFRLITLPDDDHTGVRCLYEMRNGHVLVGSRSRNVYIYHPNGELASLLSYQQYGIGAVYDAMEDNKGRLWLSTKGDGLVVGTPDASLPSGYHFTHYRHQQEDPSSISGNNVYMTHQDSQGHIWVCTLDGGLNMVSESRDGSISFYHKQNGFAHYPSYGLYSEVRNIIEDSYGHLWIGTIDGLMSIDTRFRKPEDIVFHTYHDTPNATFANNDIYTLYRDKQQQIWVGAFGGGLQRLVLTKDDQHPEKTSAVSFQPLGPREGLRNDVIFSITEDQQSHLWFATEAGLSCYSQETGRIRNFDRYDGLPSLEMEEASAMCCQDGQIWMGCKQGILTFMPQQLQTGNASYRTFILELVSDNQPYMGPVALAYTDSIELPHDKNAFTIEFAALNYLNRRNVSYRYRLEGFDRDWRYSGPHRVGSYNEVPPGRYTFVVETFDETNPSLQSTARLFIRILPPWWQTWWAYLIYIVIALLIAWIIIRTILQMNRMRNEIYISQRLAKLTTKPDEGDEFIDRLHRIIRENISNGDFNIDDLASEMGLSRSAFYKKVKSQTGFAPVDLIKEFRLSHAAELLQTTNHSITEVAYRSGFRDAGYFGKCFRKRYGMSPREYVSQ